MTISQMPRTAIVGRAPATSNYENILQKLQVPFKTLLCIGSLQEYDCLLLPGGGDITPSFFGQKNQGSFNIDTELDILQLQALDCFVRQKKPVLGICKGMQLINIFFGGNLYQQLSTSAAHEYQGTDQYHLTSASHDSILHHLFGYEFMVNSAHHQGIQLPGKALKVTQTAADGVIEGIEHTTLPILGVQWHPERLNRALPGAHEKKTTIDGSLLFQHFLSLAL